MCARASFLSCGIRVSHNIHFHFQAVVSMSDIVIDREGKRRSSQTYHTQATQILSPTPTPKYKDSRVSMPFVYMNYEVNYAYLFLGASLTKLTFISAILRSLTASVDPARQEGQGPDWMGQEQRSGGSSVREAAGRGTLHEPERRGWKGAE